MAAFVKSVERVTLTLVGGNLQTASTDLTKSQTLSKCAVLNVTARLDLAAADNRANNLHAARLYDNAGTAAIEISKYAAGSNAGATIDADVVEFNDSVTVQSGSVTMTGTSVTVTISAVTQTNAIIFFNSRATNANSGDDFNDMYVRAQFNSDTQIQFDRDAGGNPDHEIYWWIVESNGSDFQVEHVTFSGTASEQGPTNVTLSNSVTLANAFIVPSYKSSESSDDIRDAVWNLALTGSTTLTRYRNHGSTPDATADFKVAVVRSDSDGCAVQRFATDVDGQVTTNQTITAVDLDKAAVLSGHHVGVGDWAIDSTTTGADAIDRQSRIYFTSTTNVQIHRFRDTTLGGSNNLMRYEVVEFELGAGGGGPQTVPVGIASETDTAQVVTPVGGAVSVSVGLASETDTALAVTPSVGGVPQIVAVGQADETDSAEPVTPVPGAVSVSIGLAEETDSAQAVTPLPGTVTVDIGIASEINLVAPVFPVVEGGPQTVLVLNVTETDQAFPVTPVLPSGIQPAGQEIGRRRKRRYVLPDGRVFTDPNRALFELHRLLARTAPLETNRDKWIESIESEVQATPDISEEEAEFTMPSAIMARVEADLPELIQSRPLTADPIDPQLLSVLLQRIDDEEAAMLLLDV